MADWLGTSQLDSAELQESGGVVAAGYEPTAPLWTGPLDPELLQALLKRGGAERQGEGWCGPDGRRTAAVSDALIWALERIAEGADGRRRRRRH
ncbi:MAG: hypothetical protein ACM3Q9_02455 [Methanosarcina sp.]